MKPCFSAYITFSVLAAVVFVETEWASAAESMFTSITEGPMFADAGPFETSFWVDYDGDGFLDLVLTGGFETDPSRIGYKNALYRNQ